MKYLSITLCIIITLCVTSTAQNTGIGTASPQSRLHVNGTSWFQGNNTPLSGAAGAGIAIGYTSGANGGYIYAFNYSSFTSRDLYLNSPNLGGRVLIYSEVVSPQNGRLDVAGVDLNAIVGKSRDGIGVYGSSESSGSAGVDGESPNIGVQAVAISAKTDRQAIRGEVGNGATGYAGVFNGGTTWVLGTLQKNAGAFLIDHPVDPATKFLYHSFVESPDMKNIYDGITTTGSDGLSTVTMPDWFTALNMDFRYQLTVIGQFAQAVIWQELSSNKFVIKTDKPSVKVSWQITGIRHDPYANDRRIPVEKLKAPNEIGKYIYPVGYGKTDDYLLDILKPTNFAGTDVSKTAKK